MSDLIVFIPDHRLGIYFPVHKSVVFYIGTSYFEI